MSETPGRVFRSIEEVRAALYPRSAWLVDLPPDAIIEVPGGNQRASASKED